MNTEGKKSVYQIVTERVIRFIDENQTLPWQLPWKRYENEGARPRNVMSKRPYNGINVFLLGMMPYSTPFWGTMRQINELGGRVRKGEHGMPIVYWQSTEKLVKTKEGKETTKNGFFLRYYTVFNLQQTEGIDYEIPELAALEPQQKLENCERIIQGFTGRPCIQHGRDQAVYYVNQDLINMPRFEAFKSKEEYYQTLNHELLHSTGHSSRLNRDSLMKAKSSDAIFQYGKEELIAEMGASFLASEAGIDSVSFQNSAAYIQLWKGAIRADTKLLIQAASQAEKACDYILGKVNVNEQEHRTGDSSKLAA